MILDLLENGEPSSVAISVAGGGPSVTYAQLRQQVDALARSLNQLGLGRGDRIAMALPNGLEVIASFLAASIAGTAAPLNPSYTRDEFKFYLEDTGARALILPKDNSDEALNDAAGATSNDDIALILHTSGTTSRPKRVPLSHANLLTSARNVANTYQLTDEDVSLCVMPLFHVHGLVASTLATFATGGTVIVPTKFNPLSFWSTVREQHATWYSAVPTIHQVLLSRAKGARPSGAER